MWKLLSSIENVKMSGFRRKKSCQLFIEVEQIWIASSVSIVTNWLKHQKLVKEVFMFHMTMATYETKNYVMWSYFFEAKSIALQNTAIFLEEFERASSVWQCRRKVQADKSYNSKRNEIGQISDGKVAVFRWSHVININATVAKVNI